MTKIIENLVTGGCSFSQPGNRDITWPIHLEKQLRIEKPLRGGRGCADNTTIARLAIHNIYKLLRAGADPEKILVGIMWSGVYRHSAYTTKQDFAYTMFAPKHIIYCDPETEEPSNCNSNPLYITGDNFNQYLMHPNFDDESSKLYFEHFYDPIGSQIITLENVLRLQWFLKYHKISYFMTEFSWYSVHGHSPTENNTQDEILNHPDVAYLLEQIDRDFWLPIDNMTKWVVENRIPYARENDDHPSTEAHSRFVTEVVLPYLKNRGIMVESV